MSVTDRDATVEGLVAADADAVVERGERERAELERDFLLRSLDDLDEQRADGAIDDESYQRLHDEYTARAAAVIRALRDGVDTRPVAPPVSWRRRLVVIAVAGAFAVGAAIMLTRALGARRDGELASGNPPRVTQAGAPNASDRRVALEEAVAANPDDLAARLALARFLEADGDLAGALDEYEAVIARDAANAEALAQSGRIFYLTAPNAPTDDDVLALVEQARARLDAAVAADPDHADARFFRAVLYAQELLDPDQAIADAQRYLLLAPAGPFAEQARDLLANLGADAPAGEAPSGTAPTGRTP